MRSLRVLTLLVASTIVLAIMCSAAKEKLWPDVACHPVRGADYKMRLLFLNGYIKYWNKCLEQEKEKGTCPKLCYLDALNIVRMRGKHGWDDDNPSPVIVDIMRFVDFIDTVNGYRWNGTRKDEKLMDRIWKRLEACDAKRTEGGSHNHELVQLVAIRQSNKEIMKLTMDGGCAPWDPFLSCGEAAFGCVGKELGSTPRTGG